jgi:DNA-binding NtrC family response regulator
VVDLFRTQALEPIPDDGEELKYGRFEIAVVSGPDQGKVAEFGQEAVQIGSAKAVDFPLADPTISRFHLKIESNAGAFTVADLDSTNGTYLGGHRIKTAYLEGETLIELGNTKMRFRPLGDEARVTVPVRDRMGPLIGGSMKMRQLYQMVERVAKSDIPVIIEGETGTGKDLVARVVHHTSPRKDEPYEVLDCGSVPETLIQSELFGHVKGAFTGADRDREGIFERADGGTVFLDEIGELGIDMQPKLLRVLETNELKRVGGNDPIKIDVRVVCATHRSLRELVNKSKFREDLYYRLAGCKLEMPALRDRRQDIPLLVDQFLRDLREQGFEDVPEKLAPESLKVFMSRTWPGNIRQLKNAVKRVAVMGFDDAPTGEYGDEATGPVTAMTPVVTAVTSSGGIVPIRDAREQFERQYLTELMAKHPGDLDAAAEVSGMHPKSLARLLRKYDLGRFPHAE